MPRSRRLSPSTTRNRRIGVAETARVLRHRRKGPGLLLLSGSRTEPQAATFGRAGLPAIPDAAVRHYPRVIRIGPMSAFGALMGPRPPPARPALERRPTRRQRPYIDA